MNIWTIPRVGSPQFSDWIHDYICLILPNNHNPNNPNNPIDPQLTQIRLDLNTGIFTDYALPENHPHRKFRIEPLVFSDESDDE